MSKFNEITEKLAKQLDNKSNGRNAQTTTETKKHDNINVVKNSVKKKGVTKLSVSLYDFDIECLDQVKDMMRQENGVRNLSDSEALRICCRAVLETAPNYAVIYETMLAEDRRRK